MFDIFSSVKERKITSPGGRFQILQKRTMPATLSSYHFYYIKQTERVLLIDIFKKEIHPKPSHHEKTKNKNVGRIRVRQLGHKISFSPNRMRQKRRSPIATPFYKLLPVQAKNLLPLLDFSILRNLFH